MIKFLMAILSSGALNLACAELYAIAGHWSTRIVQWAARQMPINLRDRFEEEWIGVLLETSGNLSKLYFAMGCCYIALRTPSDLTIKPDDEKYLSIRSICDAYRYFYSEGVLTGSSKVSAQLWIALVDSSVPVHEVACMTDRELTTLLTCRLGYEVNDIMEASKIIETYANNDPAVEANVEFIIDYVEDDVPATLETIAVTQPVNGSDNDQDTSSEAYELSVATMRVTRLLRVQAQMYDSNAFFAESGKHIITDSGKFDLLSTEKSNYDE